MRASKPLPILKDPFPELMKRSFLGVPGEDDIRFKAKESALARSLPLPPIVAQKPLSPNLNIDSIVPVVDEAITAILGFSDEITARLIAQLLLAEDKSELMVTVTAFARSQKQAYRFVEAVWTRLLEVRANEMGRRGGRDDDDDDDDGRDEISRLRERVVADLERKRTLPHDRHARRDDFNYGGGGVRGDRNRYYEADSHQRHNDRPRDYADRERHHPHHNREGYYARRERHYDRSVHVVPHFPNARPSGDHSPPRNNVDHSEPSSSRWERILRQKAWDAANKP